MNQEDKNKVVIVTGASRGLGFSIVKELVSQGYFVIGVSRKETDLIKSFKLESKDRFVFKEFDFNDAKKIRFLVKEITSEFGAIYGLVNNAALGHDGVLATMHESQIEESLIVNSLAPIFMSKYCLRSMMLQREGRIVNIGSIISKTGFSGLSVYAASKSALTGFTRSLARELGKSKITVNTVLPGYMETEMTSGLVGEKLESIKRRSPLGELAKTEDVASLVNYLLSAEACRITGAEFTVDAGSTA